MVDVFISYSRTDKERVTQLARAIEAAGYAVWWDAELPPHQSYGEVITAKIESAKAAVVVWSKQAAASEWVRAEADAARNQKKLIQTSLDDITPPLPFNQIQCASLADWNGEEDHIGWSKVKISLAALCGERGADAAPSAAAAASPAPAHQPPLQPAPQPAPHQVQPLASAPGSGGSSKWPILAGVGVAIAGLGGGAWMMMGGTSSADQSQEISGDTPQDFEIVDFADAEFGDLPSGIPASDPTATPPVMSAPAPEYTPPPAEPAYIPEFEPEPEFAQSDGYDRNISILNNTGQTIMYLYWSSTQTSSWGEDRLGSEVFPANQGWDVEVDDGSGACNFDFRARLADGSEIDRANVNVCSVLQVSFD